MVSSGNVLIKKSTEGHGNTKDGQLILTGDIKESHMRKGNVELASS